jgi:hypothetical protein
MRPGQNSLLDSSFEAVKLFTIYFLTVLTCIGSSL